jgi:hypothetical protein
VTVQRVVLLLGILCGSTADAFAQDDTDRIAEVICLGDPECLALATHRLSADRLRTMFAVDRELVTLMKEVPELERRMDELARSVEPQRQLDEVTLAAQVHEGIPEIAYILRKHKTTGREYMMTHMVAMATAMTYGSLIPEAQHAGRNGIPSDLMTPALKFWLSMDPALKAEADEWKKMRGYDKLNR